MPLGRGGRFVGRSYVAGTPPDPPTALGDVRFTVPADHVTVVSYEVRLRQQGSGTVFANTNIGKPTPSANNTITVSLTTFFGSQPAGNYTLSVAALNANGSTDSEQSSAFSLPLS